MTLIGYLRGEGGQFVCFGDAVVTGTDDDVETQFWSSVGGDLLVPPGEVGPKALVQKLVRVADNAILGWSATSMWQDVVPLTRTLLAEVREDRLDESRARACVATFVPVGQFDGFVAISSGGKVEIVEIGTLRSVVVPGFASCWLAGSAVDEVLPTLFDFGDSLRAAGGSAACMKDLATVLVAGLLVNDLNHGTAQLHAGKGGYGGAFEVAYEDGERLQKVDQVGLVFWLSTPSQHGGRRVTGPVRALGQAYVDEETLASWATDKLVSGESPHRIRSRLILPPHLIKGPRRWAMEEELIEDERGEIPRYFLPTRPHQEACEVGDLRIDPAFLIHVVLGDPGDIHLFTRQNGDGFTLREGRISVDREALPLWLKRETEKQLARPHGP